MLTRRAFLLIALLCLQNRLVPRHASANAHSQTFFAYVIYRHPDNCIRAYRLGKAWTPSAPATVPAGLDPATEAADSSGRFLYVGNYGNGTISQFKITAAGKLIALSPASVATGAGPTCIQVVQGHILYVGHSTGLLSQYKIQRNGTLTAIPSATVDTGNAIRSLAFAANGRYAYVLMQSKVEPIGYNGSLSEYKVQPNGLLQPLTPLSPVGRGIPEPRQVMVSPDGQYAYVACDEGVLTFKISRTGTLKEVPAKNTALQAAAVRIVFEPAGRYAYIINSPSNGGGKILSYTRMGSDGTPHILKQYGILRDETLVADPVDEDSLEANVTSLAKFRNSRFLYAVDWAGDGAISQYRVNADGTIRSLKPLSVPARSAYQILIIPSQKASQ